MICLLAFQNDANAQVEKSHVNLQLRWYHQFQFAGYYAAIEQGYYRDVGLELKLVEGGFDRPGPIDQVIDNKVDFGVSSSGLMLEYLRGKPLVALASVFQKSPITWLVRADSEIYSPSDFINNTARLLGESAELKAMFLYEGIDLGKIQFQPYGQGLNDFINGDRSAFEAYMTNEPYQLGQRGIKYRLIQPIKYGIDFYGDTLFTEQRFLHENPNTVKAFVQASLKGWEYAFTHEEEIVQLIHNQYAPQKDIDHLRFEASEMRKLIMPDLIEIGHMNLRRWKFIADTYIKLGLVNTQDFNLEKFIYQPDFSPDFTKYIYTAIVLFIFGFIGWLAVGWYARVNKRLSLEINERKQVEESLRESEIRFRSLSEATFEGIIISDKEVIIDANHVANTMFGYSHHEMLGMKIINLLAHKSMGNNDQILNEDEKSSELLGLNKDGTEFPLEAHTKMYTNINKQGRVTAFRDLTDKKKAEEEIKILKGIVPICSHCKKIRDDKGYWTQIESYISKHSQAEFSHGICQECLEKYYPGMDLEEE